MDLSLVIPVFNEEENIMQLYDEILETMEGLNIDYEVLFIDDGSTDETQSLLKKIQEEDPHIKIIIFRRNFGQTAALSAGFDIAKGNVIIPMDGDLQNDPNDIPRFLEKIKEYDIVSGWRKNRKDNSLSRRLPSSIANRLISLITGVKLKDYGCTMKAYRKEVIKNIKLYGEMHRFIPAIASGIGATYCEISTNHRPRKYGSSNYGLSRIIRVLLDLLTVKFMLSFYTRPIHIFGFIGAFTGFAGISVCLYLSILKLGFGKSIGNRPLLLLGILMVILSAFFIVLGLLGEIIVRIYYETQNKKIYTIKDIIETKKDKLEIL